jgi:hypothetical protein
MLLKHALIRLRVVASSPLGMALLLFSGLVTIVFWPGLTDASGAGWPGSQISEPRGAIISVTTVLLWLVMWPMIAGSPIRGQAVKGRRSGAFAVQAHPALPIGPRMRVVAEALVVLAVIMIIRAPVLFSALIGEALQILVNNAGDNDSWRLWFIEQSLAGALVMLPFLLLGGRASSSIEAHWLRSVILTGALFGAMKLGWLETFPLCLATSLTLSALVLLAPERASRGLTMPRTLVRSGPLSRPFRSPESQFKRDLWLRPVPVAAGLLGGEVIFFILEQTIGLPYLAFYFLSVLTFSWLLTFVPLQPMRSKMAMAGLFCKPGFRPGDFAAACGVLPVRRQVMTRSIFSFGFVTTAGIWLTAIGTIVLSAWFTTGTAGLIDSDGDPLSRLLIPSLALIPAVAALLTCSILGDRKGSFISGGLLLLLPQIGLLLLIYKASGLWVGLLTVALAFIAPIPALKHLRA